MTDEQVTDPPFPSEETLSAIERHPQFRQALGANGREFFGRHYAWPVIEQKYLDMLSRLDADNREHVSRPPMEPLPGWFARRRKSCRPAAEVLAGVPAGPALPPARTPDGPGDRLGQRSARA